MFRTVVSGALMTVMLLCGSAYSQEEDIVAEGSGMGVNRQEALMAAKRAAIEKGIGVVLLSQTEVENFMVKRDQVVTKTMGAVKSYEVVSESKAPDGLFQIKIKAVLSRSTMRDDLASFHILIESMNKPRVMVIIAENNVGNEEPTNKAAETAVIQFLRDPYEFEVVDPQVTASIRASEQKMASVAGDPAAAAAIGSQYGAEVVITGNAVGREAKGMSQNLGGMVSVQADVTLKVINCTTGRIIGTANGHGARVHISPNTAGTQALGKAANAAIKDLLDVIIKEWQNQLNNGVPISLTINNVTTFRTKKAVVQTLRAISNIASVRERGWNGTSKVFKVDVQYKGTVDGLCTRIDGFKLKNAGGSFAVTGVTGTAVTLMAEAM